MGIGVILEGVLPTMEIHERRGPLAPEVSRKLPYDRNLWNEMVVHGLMDDIHFNRLRRNVPERAGNRSSHRSNQTLVFDRNLVIRAGRKGDKPWDS